MSTQVLDVVRIWGTNVKEKSYELALQSRLTIVIGGVLSFVAASFLFAGLQLSNEIMWWNFVLLSGMAFGYVFSRKKARVYATVGISLGTWASLSSIALLGFLRDHSMPYMGFASFAGWLTSIYKTGDLKTAGTLSMVVLLSGLVAASAATLKVKQNDDGFYLNIELFTEWSRSRRPAVRSVGMILKWWLWALASDYDLNAYAQCLHRRKKLAYKVALANAFKLRVQGRKKVGLS